MNPNDRKTHIHWGKLMMEGDDWSLEIDAGHIVLRGPAPESVPAALRMIAERLEPSN